MPWQRGSGSVEVELSKVQSWIENVDPILHGTGGEDKGMIREHYDSRAEWAGIKKLLGVVASLGGLSVLLQIARALHWIN